MRDALVFETAAEKIARILARQFNIQVIFDDNGARTDGKKIYLPYFTDLSTELKRDLNGFLDHEVAHCKFTKIPELQKTINRFHLELLNYCEDIRVERLMKDEFPGTANNLDPLRNKLLDEMKKVRHGFPWPIRLMSAIGDEMDHRDPIVDDDIRDYFDKCEKHRKKLNDCNDTPSVRVVTEAITKIVLDKLDEKMKKKPKKEKGKGEGGEKDDDGDCKGDPEDATMREGKGAKNSEYDKNPVTTEGFINKEISKETDKEKEKRAKTSVINTYSFSTSPHIPFTTRYDRVVNKTGKGEGSAYSKAKRSVMRFITPVRRELEKVLVAKENRKWRQDRDRGIVNPTSLARFITDNHYNTPFRELTRTETKNVAVEILIDMSGSMYGEQIEMAKQAAIAMAEALKSLSIPFEVTGFYSTTDNRISCREGRIGRYNRWNERLEHTVFKDFRSDNLTGLSLIDSNHNNVDGESVRWAASRLANQLQKRKVLMVLTDGIPNAEGQEGVLNNDLKVSVDKIRKAGIECVAFGIQTDYVKHFYPDYVIVNNIRDLPTKAMKKLVRLLG